MLTGSWSTFKDKDGNTVILVNATVHGDVFAVGCLFFYYITRGLHPFENADAGSIVINIINNTIGSLNSKVITLKID